MIGHGIKARTALGGEQVSDRVVTGIAHLDKRAQVKIHGVDDFHVSGLGAKVFRVLAEAQVSVDLINLAVDSIMFVIDEAKIGTARQVLALSALWWRSPLGLPRFLWSALVCTGFPASWPVWSTA